VACTAVVEGYYEKEWTTGQYSDVILTANAAAAAAAAAAADDADAAADDADADANLLKIAALAWTVLARLLAVEAVV